MRQLTHLLSSNRSCCLGVGLTLFVAASCEPGVPVSPNPPRTPPPSRRSQPDLNDPDTYPTSPLPTAKGAGKRR
jgi:hypothetical protein